jgi:hypothetical protein
MSAIIVRNLPVPVHDALRRVAAERHASVEAIAREALSAYARLARPGGIDFARLDADRAVAGITGDGPAWTDAMDDPALSRRVLGL